MMRASISPERALERLEQLCVRSEHCTAELMAKLRTWKITPEDTEAIIYSLQRRRFVDDGRFARAFVRDKYRFNRWGRIKIRMELRAKHIPADIIDAAMDEIDEEIYIAGLKALINSKMRVARGDDAFKIRQKIFRAAVSRGFESALVAKMLPAGCMDAPEDFYVENGESDI